MRALRVAALVALAGGIISMVGALATGDGHIALLFIFPIIYGTGPLTALAGLFFFAAFVLFFLSMVTVEDAEKNENEVYRPEYQQDQTAEQTEHRTKKGGFILIGPVPIIFGDREVLQDRRLLMLLIVLALTTAVLMLLLLYR